MNRRIPFGVMFLSCLSICFSQSDSLSTNCAKLDNRLCLIMQSEAGKVELAKGRVTNSPVSQNSNVYPIVVFSRDVQGARIVGVEPNSIENELFTARATLNQILGLTKMETVRSVTLARKRKPLLDKSVPEIRADRLQNGQFNGTQYTGKGVIVGIIDTGIDWKNLDFRSNTDTTRSRILWIWDQTIPGSVPTGYKIGAEYSQAQINDELDGTPANVVKEKDDDGHGTHVAGIAAGDGSSSASGYKGVAPDADIIAVKTTFFDSDILDGITYIRQKADAAGKPFVINLSLGSQEGPHDGTDVDEVGIDNELQSPGRAVAVAAGNEGHDAIHADSTVAQGGSITYQFSIPPYTPTAGTNNDDLWFDVWYKAGDQLAVSIKSPSGSVVSAASGSQTSVETPTDGHILIANAPGGPNLSNNAKDCTIEIFDNVAANSPRAGTWTLTINGTLVTQGGAFDIWIGFTEIAGAGGATPAFTTGYSFRRLVGSPGTSRKAITVGSYVTRWTWKSLDGNTYLFASSNRTGNYSTFSSMGPTRDGRQKPEICAPGEVIVSSYSGDSSPPIQVIVADGRHVVEEGTSMAAPHITGVLALLLQAKPSMTSDQLKNAIMASARRDDFTGPQVSAQWGYGKVDAEGAMGTILSVRKISEAMPAEFSLLQNYPNPFNPSTQIRYNLPSSFNDRVTLNVFDVLGKKVATLVDQVQREGAYSALWNAATLSSGVYFCILRADDYSAVKKMVLMK